MLLALLFPTHFLSISVTIFAIKMANEEDTAKQCVRHILPNGKEQYAKIRTCIDETEKEYKQLNDAKTFGNMWRTIIEHLPTTVIILSIWFLSSHHSALKVFLMNGFMEYFASYYKWIILIESFKLVFSLPFSVINSR